LVKDKRAGTLL